MRGVTLFITVTVSLPGLEAFRAETGAILTDKTLVVWAAPADLTQRGGAILTIDDRRSHFDGIIFGELAPGKWMAGSDQFKRSQRDQKASSEETASPDTFVQIATVYEGKSITIYRNGEQYAVYEVSHQQTFDANSIVLFGKRHLDMKGEGHFRGKISDARIYDRALTNDEISGLKPSEPSDKQPWAWWSFVEGGLQEKTGRFGEMILMGDVRMGKGGLLLGEKRATVIASPSVDAGKQIQIPGHWDANQPVPGPVIQSTRAFRERLLADPHRPAFHFCVPEDRGAPGDPNGAFYHNGRYHLMYLYNRTGSGFAWGHVSSKDLLHWRHHPDAIGVGDGDAGCFSGGAFVDNDGKAVLSYWGLWGARGICLAQNTDEQFNTWAKFKNNPVIQSTEWGITVSKDKSGQEIIFGSADPSNIWVKDGRYYMLTGNLLVLNKIGRKPDAPADQQGDRVYLFVSDDLENWEYLHPFYQWNPRWTDRSEDNMCPSFLPLPSIPDGGPPSGKYLLLFISHNKGCQYYVGRYENDKFHPETHGRMTWRDNTYFAPEALIDGQGRQIMWAWVFDDRPQGIKESSGWTGTYGLPRSLWLGKDGILNMRPVKELTALRYNERMKDDITVKAGSEVKLDGFGRELLELEIDMQPGKATKFGVKVCCSEGGEEETRLYCDVTAKKLLVDTTKSSIGFGRKNIEGGPFELKKGEALTLRVFVDRSIVEVYANDRQAVARRIYPTLGGKGVRLFAEGGDVKVLSVKAWELMPSNPY